MDPVQAVALAGGGQFLALNREDGKNVYVFGSADLLDMVHSAGLVDEYRICLAPVVRARPEPKCASGRIVQSPAGWGMVEAP